MKEGDIIISPTGKKMKKKKKKIMRKKVKENSSDQNLPKMDENEKEDQGD